MLKKLSTALFAGVMVLALAFPIAGPAKAHEAAQPVPQGGWAVRHPEMAAADQHLRQAKANLERAARDYGGHRTKAIELVNQALEEMRLAHEVTER
jgi:hypothetical protein